MLRQALHRKKQAAQSCIDKYKLHFEQVHGCDAFQQDYKTRRASSTALTALSEHCRHDGT